MPFWKKRATAGRAARPFTAVVPFGEKRATAGRAARPFAAVVPEVRFAGLAGLEILAGLEELAGLGTRMARGA